MILGSDHFEKQSIPRSLVILFGHFHFEDRSVDGRLILAPAGGQALHISNLVTKLIERLAILAPRRSTVGNGIAPSVHTLPDERNGEKFTNLTHNFQWRIPGV